MRSVVSSEVVSARDLVLRRPRTGPALIVSVMELVMETGEGILLK